MGRERRRWNTKEMNGREGMKGIKIEELEGEGREGKGGKIRMENDGKGGRYGIVKGDI